MLLGLYTVDKCGSVVIRFAVQSVARKPSLFEIGCFGSPDWGALHVVRSTKEGVYNPFVLNNINENIDASLRPYD